MAEQTGKKSLRLDQGFMVASPIVGIVAGIVGVAIAITGLTI
jgi:hypothetical protein